MKRPVFLDAPARWLAGLGQRERWVVVGGMVLLMGMLVVLFGVQPVLEWMDNQTRLVTDKAATLEWMKHSAAEVVRLRAAGGRGTPVANGESLLALADRTAKEKGLGGALQRVEPEGQGRVRLWFEKVSFEGLMAWMTELSQRYAARGENVTVDREEEPGRVRARVVLSWPEQKR